MLTKFIDMAGLKRNQFMLLLVMALICLGLVFAVLMEKFREQPTYNTIKQVKNPAKTNFEWFGEEIKSQKEIDLSNIPENLPFANIDAQLLGVVLAGEASTATLKFGGSKEHVHFIGDKIEGETKIVDIQGYRIVVLQGGVNKQMVMKKPDIIIEKSKGVAKTPLSSNGGFAFANMFGAVPVMAAGTTGFKLNDVSTEVQSLADVREGDVVIGLDGAPMQDIMADPANWNKFAFSTNLPVTVMRGGKKQIIYINAASLSAKIMPKSGIKP